MGLALGIQGGTSRTQPSDPNGYISGLRGADTMQADSRAKLVDQYKYVLMLVESCKDYHTDGSYRVVHWRARVGVLSSSIVSYNIQYH